eukprot:CAMPEP_0119262170 /NCGR_PEP_ID=MMETSP1329-20130426/1976_1 /TAXON_ID=114041 /ORGANISM="Genus nov. species nov., Strain RCC1024" /LENGTH=333 /DNA_ID=CAMNT_0007261787 /DNA_START=105 /DNA_END=1102 /DNA_ORIENTATION=-
MLRSTVVLCCLAAVGRALVARRRRHRPASLERAAQLSEGEAAEQRAMFETGADVNARADTRAEQPALEDRTHAEGGVLGWLQARRDVFEPAWPWLVARREWSDVVKEGRRAEAVRLARGKQIIQRSIRKLVRADIEARDELAQFLDDEWAREAAARGAARQFLDDEWAREAAARGAARQFLDDEWAREADAQREARAFIADEFERLADADEELAARIRGAPELTVCAAPIACGKADGHLVYDRLQALAAAEAGDGRPAPLVRCATKCSSNCRAGKVAVTLGAPRREVFYLDTAPDACEDALGYCNPADVDAKREGSVDRQLGALLRRSRMSTR